jgi:hypothetical protein
MQTSTKIARNVILKQVALTRSAAKSSICEHDSTAALGVLLGLPAVHLVATAERLSGWAGDWT